MIYGSDINKHDIENELINILKHREYLIKLFADIDDIGSHLSKQCKLKILSLYDLSVDKYVKHYVELCGHFLQSVSFHLRQQKLNDIIVKIIKQLTNDNVKTGYDPNFTNNARKDVSFLLVQKMTGRTFARTCQTLRMIKRVLSQT